MRDFAIASFSYMDLYFLYLRAISEDIVNKMIYNGFATVD